MIKSTHYRSLPIFREDSLPIRLHEVQSMSRVWSGFVVALSFAGVLAAPVAIVSAAFIFQHADFTSVPGELVRSGLAILPAFVAVSVLCILLVAALMQKFAPQRVITINETHVTVRDRSLFTSREWREPLVRYCGVESKEHLALASGYREYSLVLIHPQSEREIAVWSGECAPDAALVCGYRSLLSRAVTRQS